MNRQQLQQYLSNKQGNLLPRYNRMNNTKVVPAMLETSGNVTAVHWRYYDMFNISQKRCSKCGEWKDKSEFYKSKQSKDNLYSYCKSCKDSARKEYHLKNLEREIIRSKEYQRKWYQEHKEEKNSQSREWVLRNPEKARGFVRKYRASNIAKVREQVRQYIAKNKELIAARYKAWSIANPEKERMRAKNRRARVNGSHGVTTPQEWEKLKKKYNYTCLCCGRSEPEIKLTRDHVKPIILGGDNTIQNSQPLCASCNSRKGTKEVDYR